VDISPVGALPDRDQEMWVRAGPRLTLPPCPAAEEESLDLDAVSTGGAALVAARVAWAVLARAGGLGAALLAERAGGGVDAVEAGPALAHLARVGQALG